MNNSTHLDFFKSFQADLIKVAEDNDLPIAAIENYLDFEKVGRKSQIGRTYHKVIDFLNQSQLWANEQFNALFQPNEKYGREAFTGHGLDDDQMSSMTTDLLNLCRECKVPNDQIMTTVTNLALILRRYCNSNAFTGHFSTDTSNATNLRTPQTIYPAGALTDVSYNKHVGQEAFGVTMDQVIPDLKAALTVTLLKPHKGIMSRFMHRKTVAGSVISYVINYDEYYDLAASQNKEGSVRNSFDHRHNLINLYRNPDPVNMVLTPIIPMKVNDTEDDLVADGIIKFNRRVNIFDLSTDPLKINFEKINYTDLVSERVIVKGVHLKITKGSTTEEYFLDTESLPLAQLNMIQTSINNSADKATKFLAGIQLDKDATPTNPQTTEIFKGVDKSVEYVQLILDISADINLMTAVVHAMCSPTLRPVSSVSGQLPSDELKNLVNSCTVEIVGYELEARFSEENLRKTNMAARSLTTMITYELPQGKTIVVDFSMQQALPEHVLNVAQEIQSIGIDHRNVQMFMKTMKSVYDRVINERSDPNYKENYGGHDVNSAFVSGTKVNPEIFLGTIDLTRAVSIRSSDMLSDIREFVMAYMNKVLSIIHYRSLYLQNLDQGEVPTYKVLTSSPIIENMFSIPQIHAHLMESGMSGDQIFKEVTPGEPIEYTRKLYSGVKLEMITSAFNYLKNTIIIVPYRPGDPASDLNFGHNNDGGEFVANYTPNDGQQVNRRVFMNTREWPIITCPVGAILKVVGLESYLPDINKSSDNPDLP